MCRGTNGYGFDISHNSAQPGNVVDWREVKPPISDARCRDTAMVVHFVSVLDQRTPVASSGSLRFHEITIFRNYFCTELKVFSGTIIAVLPGNLEVSILPGCEYFSNVIISKTKAPPTRNSVPLQRSRGDFSVCWRALATAWYLRSLRQSRLGNIGTRWWRHLQVLRQP